MCDAPPMRLTIRPFLMAAGLSQAKLADKADIKPGYLSEIISGKKAPSMEVLERIADALGVPPHALLAPEDGAPDPAGAGFAEPDVAPYTPGTSALDKAVRALCAALKTPDTRTAARAHPGLSICRGDVLVMELGGPPRAGDVVFATLSTEDGMTQETVLRRYVPGWLIDTDAPPIDIARANQGVAILGRLAGVVRAP